MDKNAALPTEQAAGQRSDAPHGEDLGLPVRARDVLVVRRVRLADDPEMLEMILAGLLRMR